MDKTKVFSVVAVVAIVLSGYVAFFRPAQVKTTEVVKEVVREIESSPDFAGAPGPDFFSEYLSVNGVQKFYYSSPFNQGSTTLCNFRAPLTGTSTLAFASAKATTGTTTALSLEWGKAASPYATTTSLGYGVVASNLQWTAIASTTPGAFPTGVAYIDPQFVFKAGQYLAFKYGGAQGTTNTLAGSCKAQFIVN